MKTLGAILNTLKGSRKVFINIHDLSAKRTDELQMALNPNFVRVDRKNLKLAGHAPYESTAFNANKAYGFDGVYITVYRDKQKKGGDKK